MQARRQHQHPGRHKLRAQRGCREAKPRPPTHPHPPPTYTPTHPPLGARAADPVAAAAAAVLCSQRSVSLRMCTTAWPPHTARSPSRIWAASPRAKITTSVPCRGGAGGWGLGLGVGVGGVGWVNGGGGLDSFLFMGVVGHSPPCSSAAGWGQPLCGPAGAWPRTVGGGCGSAATVRLFPSYSVGSEVPLRAYRGGQRTGVQRKAGCIRTCTCTRQRARLLAAPPVHPRNHPPTLAPGQAAKRSSHAGHGCTRGAGQACRWAWQPAAHPQLCQALAPARNDVKGTCGMQQCGVLQAGGHPVLRQACRGSEGVRVWYGSWRVWWVQGWSCRRVRRVQRGRVPGSAQYSRLAGASAGLLDRSLRFRQGEGTGGRDATPPCSVQVSAGGSSAISCAAAGSHPRRCGAAAQHPRAPARCPLWRCRWPPGPARLCRKSCARRSWAAGLTEWRR